MEKFALIFCLLSIVACNKVIKRVERLIDPRIENEERQIAESEKSAASISHTPVPRSCCWCKEGNSTNNVLFPVADKLDNCSKKNLSNYKDCKRVEITEGTCSLVDLVRAGRGFQCKPQVRYYVVNGVENQIQPPSETEGVCNPKTRDLIRNFAAQEDRRERAEYLERREKSRQELQRLAEGLPPATPNADPEAGSSKQ